VEKATDRKSMAAAKGTISVEPSLKGQDESKGWRSPHSALKEPSITGWIAKNSRKEKNVMGLKEGLSWGC